MFFFIILASSVLLMALGAVTYDFFRRERFEDMANSLDDVPTGEIWPSIADPPQEEETSSKELLESLELLLRERKPAECRLDRVEVYVCGFDLDWQGKRHRVSRLVCVAAYRNGRVLVRIGNQSVYMGTELVSCADLYLQLCEEMESSLGTNPIGFLYELMEKFPEGSYAAAVGAPYAVPYYREAA